MCLGARGGTPAGGCRVPPGGPAPERRGLPTLPDGASPAVSVGAAPTTARYQSTWSGGSRMIRCASGPGALTGHTLPISGGPRAPPPRRQSRAGSAGTCRSRLRLGPRQAARRHRARRGALPDGYRPDRRGAALGDRRLRATSDRPLDGTPTRTAPAVLSRLGSARRSARQSTLRSGMAAPPAILADRWDSWARTANPEPRIQRNGACQRAGYRRDR